MTHYDEENDDSSGIILFSFWQKSAIIEKKISNNEKTDCFDSDGLYTEYFLGCRGIWFAAVRRKKIVS